MTKIYKFTISGEELVFEEETTDLDLAITTFAVAEDVIFTIKNTFEGKHTINVFFEDDKGEQYTARRIHSRPGGYEQHKTYDGPHFLAIETRKAEIETGINFDFLGKDMIKKEYQLPNGYTVSVIKGEIHTFGKWEVVTYFGSNQNVIKSDRFTDWAGVEEHIQHVLSLERP